MTKRITPTTLGHANFIAFAKTTSLAALTPVLVYSALICCWTDVVIMSCDKTGEGTFNLLCSFY